MTGQFIGTNNWLNFQQMHNTFKQSCTTKTQPELALADYSIVMLNVYESNGYTEDRHDRLMKGLEIVHPRVYDVRCMASVVDKSSPSGRCANPLPKVELLNTLKILVNVADDNSLQGDALGMELWGLAQKLCCARNNHKNQAIQIAIRWFDVIMRYRAYCDSISQTSCKS